MRQNQPAVQLPPRIMPDPCAMAGIVVARHLALRPVAEIMNANHAERPRHSDQCAEIDAEMFEPQWALEARMNQASMHPDRMAEAEGHRACRDEQQKCLP